MKRWQRVLLILFLFLFSCFVLDRVAGAGLIPYSTELGSISYLLPLWALVSFGAYSLFCVAYRLATFPECPKAAEELAQQRERALKDLASKGYKKPVKIKAD